MELQVLPNNFVYSQYPRNRTRILVVSEVGDEVVVCGAFVANDVQCESLTLDAQQLLALISSKGINWIHFHLGEKTTLTSQMVNQIKSYISGVRVTAWTGSTPDDKLLEALRSVDVALVGNEITVAAYRAAGCDVELWNLSTDMKASTKELMVRLGCFEVMVHDLSKSRMSYTFKRILCIMRETPAMLTICHSEDGIEFMAASFTECRDLTLKIIQFNPDLLYIHLDAQDDNLPWRDLLLDLRRRMPGMLVVLWHQGNQGIDQRVMNLRFSVDHIMIGSIATVSQYHAESLLGTTMWTPTALPFDDPIIFRNAMFAFMRSMGEKRKAFLTTPQGVMVDLTIFIGTYNRLDQLRKAVDSALVSIGLRSVEIVVNDAGSTDGTQNWLHEKASEDERIVPIFSGKRTSFTQAFNEALQIAKGKYICWLSDDIVSENTALSDMCGIMDNVSPLDMGGFCVRNSWGPEYQVRKDSGYYTPPVGCMYTETLRKLNGINMDYPYYGQDSDLNTRVLRIGGRIIAALDCRLLHNCRNDQLRRSNYANHSNTMCDVKYELAMWRPAEATRLPYLTVLLVPSENCAFERVMKTVDQIRAHYLNSHIFVASETSRNLDIHGPNSFLRRVPAIHRKHLFDLVIHIEPNKSILIQPSTQSNSPFVRKMLQG
jgi:GT2 family glycosyltransferase